MSEERPPRKCYNCGRYGHLSRDCRDPPRQRPNAQPQQRAHNDERSRDFVQRQQDQINQERGYVPPQQRQPQGHNQRWPNQRPGSSRQNAAPRPPREASRPRQQNRTGGQYGGVPQGLPTAATSRRRQQNEHQYMLQRGEAPKRPYQPQILRRVQMVNPVGMAQPQVFENQGQAGQRDQQLQMGQYRETEDPTEPLVPLGEQRDQEMEDLRDPPALPDEQRDEEVLREPPASPDELLSDDGSMDDSMSELSQRTLRGHSQDDGWARRSEEEGPNVPFTYSEEFMNSAETAWSFNPIRQTPIGAKSRSGHHFVLVSPDGIPHPTSYFVTNSFVGLSLAIVENPKKAASNAPLAIRIKDRELPTGTIVMVHQLSRVLDRMGNPVEFQYADTPISDCVVNGWLKPTAIAEQYHVNPQTTNKVQRELAATGKPSKKVVGGIERWTTPVLSRSFPYGALATNHSISWKFNDIPQGGSLVHAAIYVVEPGSGQVAVRNVDFSSALRNDQYSFVLPRYYRGKLDGALEGQSPEERDEPIPVLCGIHPVPTELEIAVERLLPVKLNLTYEQFHGDIPCATHPLGTYAQLYLDLVVITACVCRHKLIRSMAVAEITGTIVDPKEDKTFVVQLDDCASESKLVAIARYLTQDTTVVMEEDMSSADMPRSPHRLTLQSLTNFGEPESVRTSNGDRDNCVILQYVSRDLQKRHREAEKQALNELDELAQLMRDTVLDDEQKNELAALEKEIEKSDFGQMETEAEESDPHIEEEETEETAFSLWYSKASESKVRIRPDIRRTGWEAKIAVLQSISVDFLKTTLGTALMGLEHPVPDVAAPKPSGHAGVVSKLEKKKLNERQMECVRQILDPSNIAIRIEAPASTGKTRTMVMACGGLTVLYPNARFILTAETNQAGAKLIEEVTSVMKPQDQAVFYVVSMAQELRGDFARDHPVFVYGITPHLKALIKQTEDNIRQKSKKKDTKAKAEVGPLSLLELKRAKIFVAIKAADFRAPLDDAPMIELVLAKNPAIQIVVTTCSKLQAHKALQACHTIFFDESSVSSDGDLMALASATGTKKFVTAGDRKQLLNHVLTGLEAFKAFGLRSMADIVADRAIAKSCELNEAYRPHPIIFEPWNLAVYEGLVQCRTRAEDRALITKSTFPLPKQGVPIVLIHDSARFSKGPAKSLSNEAHESMAFRLIARLHVAVPKLKIAVICHYVDTRNKMKELMRIYDKRSQVTVATIDAYEGQEQEAVIVLTTRTSGSSNFVVDERRLASAITRPRDFIAVIGDLDYLEAGALWSKYLVASVKLTPPVDAAYVDLITQKDFVTKYSESGRLLDATGKPVTSSSIFAVQWVEATALQAAPANK